MVYASYDDALLERSRQQFTPYKDSEYYHARTGMEKDAKTAEALGTLDMGHAMPFWCQQNESTNHFLKSLTFRRPTFLFFAILILRLSFLASSKKRETDSPSLLESADIPATHASLL